MEQNYVYFQPEYVNKFKCEGQKCNAHCCKYWNIDIDKETYKKYKSIKPKMDSKKITDKIRKDGNRYLINMTDKYLCPFIDEENYCSIQRKYGAEYLSNTCMTYPRKTRRIGNFYEMSLTLSCPIAAMLILNEKEPMTFEQTIVPKEIYYNNCRDMVLMSANMPDEFVDHFVSVQYAIISLLQERRLTIDQRLILIGYYCAELERLIKEERFKEVETLGAIFTSEEFLNGQAKDLIKTIDFNVKEYMKIMFEFFGAIYGESEGEKADAQVYLNFMVYMLDIKLDENGTAALSDLIRNYNKHLAEGKEFLNEYNYIFENFLVNEFFAYIYPFRTIEGVTLDYGLFIATYKIVELLAMSMSIAQKDFINKEIDSRKIIELLSWFATRSDHGQKYLPPIIKLLKEKNDVKKIMTSLLQG